ncbi:MAG: AAA family ATPase [Saprospiraceae bacterium]|nr:AAA family ATPase [Saprospiraceae bacterium]
MSETNQAYISRVHLKGYKSIRDLEIDLKPGLNIIIGPNGSGKTNFLEFLETISENNLEIDDVNLYSKIDFYLNENIYTNKIESSYEKEPNLKLLTTDRLLKGEEEVYSKQFILDEFLNERTSIQKEKKEEKNKLFPIPILIKHGNPLNEALTTGSSLKILKIKSGELVIRNIKGIYPSSFKEKINLDPIPDLKKVKKYFEFEPKIIDILHRFTPIQDVRFDKDSIRQFKDKSSSNIIVENIFLNFKVNKEWYQWSQLSDGTKRLFYLVTYVYDYYLNRKIFFVEEPELGIHPDQLYKLMDFLKEQSKEKQIIITTHSPEVLNILGKDELDHIIVTRYDEEKGTQMHRLSPTQIKKGQTYMEKVGHLSDYWVHSNLEEYEIEE